MRKSVPDIVIRTTLISGFPGESDEDHEILKDFVRSMKFDRLGVFTYSQEEGTPAAGMDNQIDEDLKLARRNELMEIFSHALRNNGYGNSNPKFLQCSIRLM